jgi:DNA-binding transcriptional ArsR family regulator
MVQHLSDPGTTFAALGDPVRRRLVGLVAGGTSAPSVLATQVGLSLPGTLKHLAVLERAGLVTRSKAGRTVTVVLRPEPMVEAEEWLQRTRSFWTHQLAGLAGSFTPARPTPEERPR